MNKRILQLVDYYAHGNRKAFAERIGWSQQYLSNLLKRDDGIGLAPVLDILKEIDEVDARWLLLGEGDMLTMQNAARRVGSILMATDFHLTDTESKYRKRTKSANHLHVISETSAKD